MTGTRKISIHRESLVDLRTGIRPISLLYFDRMNEEISLSEVTVTLEVRVEILEGAQNSSKEKNGKN
jgi:hypothetical protein